MATDDGDRGGVRRRRLARDRDSLRRANLKTTWIALGLLTLALVLTSVRGVMMEYDSCQRDQVLREEINTADAAIYLTLSAAAPAARAQGDPQRAARFEWLVSRMVYVPPTDCVRALLPGYDSPQVVRYQARPGLARRAVEADRR